MKDCDPELAMRRRCWDRRMCQTTIMTSKMCDKVEHVRLLLGLLSILGFYLASVDVTQSTRVQMTKMIDIEYTKTDLCVVECYVRC